VPLACRWAAFVMPPTSSRSGRGSYGGCAPCSLTLAPASPPSASLTQGSFCTMHNNNNYYYNTNL